MTFQGGWSAGGGEQTERIPPVTPGVADSVIGVEDHRSKPAAGKLVTGGQAGLPGTNNDRLMKVVT